MKLRHPGLIRLAGLLAAIIVRSLFGTVRTREYLVDPTVLPDRTTGKQRYIYAFWHEGLLYLAGRYGHHKNIAILISRHADGELIAQACRWIGIRTVRGSTAKAGAAALQKMLEFAHRGHLAITPDGPRGPRREVQLGTVFLASRTGFHIVPIGVAYKSAWYTRSWDRMGIPHPFSQAAGVAGEPLVIPPGLEKDELQKYADLLQQRMVNATRQAEVWLQKAKW